MVVGGLAKEVVPERSQVPEGLDAHIEKTVVFTTVLHTFESDVVGLLVAESFNHCFFTNFMQ